MIHHFTYFFILDISPCLDNELNEFPLRMRDWLKNVLVTLYERDEDNNMLNEKQKLRVCELFVFRLMWFINLILDE